MMEAARKGDPSEVSSRSPIRPARGAAEFNTILLHNRAQVTRLLAHDPKLIHARRWYDGYTPLMKAAEKNHHRVVRCLLQMGLGVDEADHDGWTALLYACYKGRTPVVEVLLEFGASCAVRCSISGLTPLMQASREGHLDTVKCLLQSAGAVDTIDRVGAEGGTALWWACHDGYPVIVKTLLEAGADPTIVDGIRRSPLTIARLNNHHHCIRVLQVRSLPPKPRGCILVTVVCSLPHFQEWERAFLLCKARGLVDAVADLSDPSLKTTPLRVSVAPPWLKARLERGEGVPGVGLGSGVGGSPGGGKRKREGEWGGKGSLAAAVASYAIQDMKGVLFVELMEMIGRVPPAEEYDDYDFGDEDDDCGSSTDSSVYSSTTEEGESDEEDEGEEGRGDCAAVETGKQVPCGGQGGEAKQEWSLLDYLPVGDSQ
jgi:hypothetical protein